MRSKAAQRMLAKIPVATKLYVRRYAALVVRVNFLLRKRGYDLQHPATNASEAPPLIKSWLEGNFDFSLRSIGALEGALGERLWEGGKTAIPDEFMQSKTPGQN